MGDMWIYTAYLDIQNDELCLSIMKYYGTS